MRLALGAAMIAGALCVSAAARAGEIGGGLGSCEIGGLLGGCTWKAKDCYKPSPPFFFAHDVDSYNLAVSEFNSYLAEVDAYKNCIIAEGKRDLSEKLPHIVAEGAKQQMHEATDDAEEARSNLELMRPRN